MLISPFSGDFLIKLTPFPEHVIPLEPWGQVCVIISVRFTQAPLKHILSVSHLVPSDTIPIANGGPLALSWIILKLGNSISTLL